MRVNMAEAFQARGIYPYNVTSLDPTALLWERLEPKELPPLPIHTMGIMQWVLGEAANFSRRVLSQESSHEPSRQEREIDLQDAGAALDDDSAQEGPDFSLIREELYNYVMQPGVAIRLGLDPSPERPIRVHGFHPVFRVNPYGQLLVELITQFVQKDDAVQEDFQTYGGVPFRGGATLIAAADGSPRYVISKPLVSASLSRERQREAKERLEQQKAFVADCDRRDSQLAWADSRYYRNRIALNMNFSAIHSEIIR
jgi:hypothetical protein